MSDQIIRDHGDAQIEPLDAEPAHGSAEIPRKRPGVLVAFAGAAAILCLVIWTVEELSAAEKPVARSTRIDPNAATTTDTNAINAAPAVAAAKVVLAVKATRPVSMELRPTIALEGTLAPLQSTWLSFSVAGLLTHLSVRVGDEVRAGARLARLDTSHAATHYAVTGARVRAATAQFTLAADHADRNTALVASGALQAAGAIDSRLHTSVAAAELEAARAQHTEAQYVLNEHTLRAPFAGTVVEAPDAVGGIVNAGAPLFRLVDLTKLKLNASVTEAEAARLAVGAKLAIETPDGPVAAHITKIRSTLDAQTHRVPIEAELEASGTLRAGAFVRARVETAHSVPALRLPSDVLRAGSRDEVFVVDQGPKPKLAVKRIVHEPDIDGALLVRSGLGIDDLVVCAPSSTSKPGDAVEIADISASALEP